MSSDLPRGYLSALDHGYVGLVDWMGTDLSVTAAARVSYDKIPTKWDEKEERLLKFLAREGHTSPFRHPKLSFEIYAPLMVCRQWVKHVVDSSHVEDGLAHNESSRRYVTEEPIFYIPKFTEWRSAPANSKQGSGDSMGPRIGGYFMLELQEHVENSVRLYEKALDHGVAPEQARLFLPANGMYVRWRWAMSLQALIHFLQERLASDAQWEIVEYASLVHELAVEKFPKSFEAFGL